MTVTVKNIIPAKDAETTQTGQYTAINCKTIIDKFTGTNTTGANILISVNLVPQGGTAADSNAIIIDRAIAPGETFNFPGLVGQVIEPQGFISAVASATGLTISASGREIT